VTIRDRVATHWNSFAPRRKHQAEHLVDVGEVALVKALAISGLAASHT